MTAHANLSIAFHYQDKCMHQVTLHCKGLGERKIVNTHGLSLVTFQKAWQPSQLILPLLPRCKFVPFLPGTWLARRRVVFTDTLEIQSSTVSVEPSAGSSDIPCAQFFFSIYPQVEQLPKGDFHWWLSCLLFVSNMIIYPSPVSMCGWLKSLERVFQWAMAKIIDKKQTLPAGLNFNNLHWPPGTPG